MTKCEWRPDVDPDGKMRDGFTSYVTFPKDLTITEPVEVTTAYDPLLVKKLYDDLLHMTQTITIYPPPLFIMSPRTKIYKAADIKKFKGYLSKFEPVASIEDEKPQLEMTIIPTNQEN